MSKFKCRAYFHNQYVCFILGFMPLVFQKSSPRILFTVCQSLSTISLGTLGLSFYYSQELDLDFIKWLPLISIIFIFLMRAMGK